MLVENNENSVLITLSRKEALMLLACARESFAAIHENEYDLRIGYSIDDVSAMAKEFKALLESIGVIE
jgi:hypothetical protein